jgi:hypothetical protein
MDKSPGPKVLFTLFNLFSPEEIEKEIHKKINIRNEINFNIIKKEAHC